MVFADWSLKSMEPVKSFCLDESWFLVILGTFETKDDVCLPWPNLWPIERSLGRSPFDSSLSSDRYGDRSFCTTELSSGSIDDLVSCSSSRDASLDSPIIGFLIESFPLELDDCRSLAGIVS